MAWTFISRLGEFMALIEKAAIKNIYNLGKKWFNEEQPTEAISPVDIEDQQEEIEPQDLNDDETQEIEFQDNEDQEDEQEVLETIEETVEVQSEVLEIQPETLKTVEIQPEVLELETVEVQPDKSNRDSLGQWTDRSDSPSALFNSQTGRDAANKRWEGYRIATVRGVIKRAREKFPDDDIKTPEEAWQKIAESHYEHALEKTPSAKLILEGLDALPRGGGNEGGTTIEKQQVNIIMMPFKGMPNDIQELANTLREDGDIKTAAYIEAQIEFDNDNEQRVEYPREVRIWPKRR